ncbi:MAG: hypothetical protein ACI89E_001127, partial [Planctomycetota bacterium]
VLEDAVESGLDVAQGQVHGPVQEGFVLGLATFGFEAAQYGVAR